MVKFGVLILLLAFQFSVIECETKFRFLSMECFVSNPKYGTVHECNAEGLFLNLSLTLNRKFFEPILVSHPSHLCDYFIYFVFTEVQS